MIKIINEQLQELHELYLKKEMHTHGDICTEEECLVCKRCQQDNKMYDAIHDLIATVRKLQTELDKIDPWRFESVSLSQYGDWFCVFCGANKNDDHTVDCIKTKKDL